MANQVLMLQLSNLALAGVLAVVAFGMTRIWRNPHLAHALWLLVLIKLVTPPFVSLRLPRFLEPSHKAVIVERSNTPLLRSSELDRVPNNGDSQQRFATNSVVKQAEAADANMPDADVAGRQDIVLADTNGEVGEIASAPRSTILTVFPSWQSIILGAWAVGIFPFVYLAVVRQRRLLQFVAKAEPPDDVLQNEGEDIARRMGLRKCPTLYLTNEPIGPLLMIGLRNQRVLLPSKLISEFSREQTRSVLAHELAHLRRSDHFVRCVELFVLAVQWWNPLAWLASRMLRQAEEQCCDAAVVSVLPDDRRSYGTALLRTIEFLTECQERSAVVGTAFGENTFKNRIERIMNQNVTTRWSFRSRGVAMLVGVLVLPFSVAAPLIATEANANEPPAVADAQKSGSPNSSEPGSAEKNGGKVATFAPLPFPRDKPHRLDAIDQVEFSADGKSLFVAAHRAGELGIFGRKPATHWIEHWDVATTKKLATVTDLAAPMTVAANGESLIALAGKVAQRGRYVARTSQLVAYDLKKSRITRRLDVDSGYAFGVALAPTGKSVISCSKTYSRATKRWINGHLIATSIDGRKQWEHRWKSGRLSVVDWSPDGSTVFGAGRGGAFAWRSNSGKLLWERDDHPNHVESIACSSDGRYVATGSYFNPSSGFGFVGRAHSVIKIRGAKDGKPIRTVKLYHDGVVRPLELAFAPNGRSIAVALGSYNRGQHWGEVRIVDVKTGQTKATLLKDHPQPVTSVSFSPDGKILCAGTFDGLVKLWQIGAAQPNLVEGVRADVIGQWLFDDKFLEGLGESIERDLRKKLGLRSEMEWKLVASVDDHFPSAVFDDERSVLLIHLMLPSDKLQPSKTIILNTSDHPSPFLKFTRSYGAVTRPTAVLTAAVSKPGSKQAVSHEVELSWKKDRWVKVKRSIIKRTID